MRVLLRAILLLLPALPVLATVAIVASFQDTPRVTGIAPLTVHDVERAKRVVDAQDLRRAGPDRLQSIAIDERDLGLAMNYLAARYGRAATRVQLRPGVASLQATVELPANPIGRYLNIDATLRENAPLPTVERLTVGRVPVPGFVADYILRAGLRQLAATDRAQVAAMVVRSASFGEGLMEITYQWSGDVAAVAHSVLVEPDAQARLRAYQERLAEVAAGAPRSISLAKVMPPIFDLAFERGAAGDPARENRAALLVLALYSVGKPLDRVVPAAAQWPQPARRTLTLAGRDDFPKHFLVSAVLSAEAGSPLADAIGVYKEVEDSRGGSGFSFNDIAADRAGTRFGEVASQSPARAKELAQAIAAGVAESDFMPDVSDLPEYLSERDLKRRYGGVGGPGYNRLLADIDARVATRPLLR